MPTLDITFASGESSVSVTASPSTSSSATATPAVTLNVAGTGHVALPSTSFVHP